MSNPDLSMRPAGVMSPWRADPYRRRDTPAEVVAEEANARDRLPELCLTIGVGVFLVASADTAARFSKGWAPVAFWLGVLMMFVPVALRLARGAPTRREGLGIVLALGLGLYLSRVVRAPLGASSDDEFMHLRTAEDIFRTGHLFASNPLLPVSSLYPGIEILVTAVAKITGLGIFTSALVVVGTARLVHIASIFFVLLLASGSSRVATIATVLFTASSTFFYFDAMFAYESLAIPLGTLLIFLTLRVAKMEWAQERRLGLGFLAALTAFSLVVTHHVTAFVIAGLLLVWAVVRAARGGGERSPIWLALVLALASAAWALLVARIVFGYLGSGPLGSALRGLPSLAHGNLPRTPFQAANGGGVNINDRLIGLLGTTMTISGLALTLPFYWRRYRRSSLGIVLGAVALIYPATLALRFLPGGWDVSNRSSGFLFLGVAFVLAVGLVECRYRLLRRWRSLVIAAFLIVVPVSGIVLGTDPTGRLPGKYHVAAGARSIEPIGISAARWAGSHLPQGTPIAADNINTLLLASYGHQHALADVSRGLELSPLFLTPRFQGWQRNILRRNHISYLVIDRRIIGHSTPPDGFFYEPWELAAVPGAYSARNPISARVLMKYDRTPGVQRVFDDGSIVIYDVRALR